MNEPSILYDKAIQCNLIIRTTQSDFDACDMVERALKMSMLNNSELCLDIESIKVINKIESKMK